MNDVVWLAAESLCDMINKLVPKSDNPEHGKCKWVGIQKYHITHCWESPLSTYGGKSTLSIYGNSVYVDMIIYTDVVVGTGHPGWNLLHTDLSNPDAIDAIVTAYRRIGKIYANYGQRRP